MYVYEMYLVGGAIAGDEPIVKLIGPGCVETIEDKETINTLIEWKTFGGIDYVNFMLKETGLLDEAFYLPMWAVDG